MGKQDVFKLGQSDLNDFLFAEIEVEGSGMPLSVISALARQGLDPWQEAGRLAGLPRTAATDGLVGMIASLPTNLLALSDVKVVAARLVALLPGQAGPVPRDIPGPDARTQSKIAWLVIAVMTVTMVVSVAAYVAPSAAPPKSMPSEAVAPPKLVPD